MTGFIFRLICSSFVPTSFLGFKIIQKDAKGKMKSKETPIMKSKETPIMKSMETPFMKVDEGLLEEINKLADVLCRLVDKRKTITEKHGKEMEDIARKLDLTETGTTLAKVVGAGALTVGRSFLKVIIMYLCFWGRRAAETIWNKPHFWSAKIVYGENADLP